VLSLIGLWALFCWIVDNFRSITQIIVTVLTPYFRPVEQKKLSEKFGPWAVLTGSTDGIGKAYAKKLAKQGMNIVLISRTKSKLIEVANEIEAEYSVKTKYIVADFSEGQKIYEPIRQELSKLQIGILVNNVGRNYDFPNNVDQVSEKLIWDIININIGATTMMTRMVIPMMKLNGRGMIVNIGSGSELQPMPYMAIYGCSKVFVRNFTLAIQKELEPFNIQVQLLSPMFVSTKMNDYSKSIRNVNVFVPDVDTYTRSAVFTLTKTDQTNGYFAHGLQFALIKLSPEWMRLWFATRLNRKFRDDYLKLHGNKVQ
jgi:17beta-estradiol 17-dehydrogenase / very-long-chain 3-oxoacyl-CoA reductase